MAQIRKPMTDDGDDGERLGGKEELRLMSAEGAETEERAEERELRKAHRTGRGGGDRADAARLFQPGFHAQKMQLRIILSNADAEAAEGVTTA